MVAKADVFEEAGDYVVEVELPGAIADSVEILLDDAVLTIRGLGSCPGGRSVRTYSRRERMPGPFERHISLPGPVWRDCAARKFVLVPVT